MFSGLYSKKTLGYLLFENCSSVVDESDSLQRGRVQSVVLERLFFVFLWSLLHTLRYSTSLRFSVYTAQLFTTVLLLTHHLEERLMVVKHPHYLLWWDALQEWTSLASHLL